jgi:Tfp pilus assembly protein PilN
MIEINLLPGSTRRARRSFKLPLPGLQKLKAGSGVDRWSATMATGWILGPLLIAWLFFGTRARASEVEIAIEGAVRDSSRYATLIAANETLRSRQQTITEKLQMIQEIDVSRYVWAHVLDEISAAVPANTWLVSVIQTGGGQGEFRPRIEIQGRTGNQFALTQFMRDLEASPFLRGVTLVNTQQVRLDNRWVYTFSLHLQYRDPPPDAIQTVPVFADLEVQ